MPKKREDLHQSGPYHISCRCINQEWFQIPMDDVWDIFTSQLYFLKFAFNFKIHNFVLMNNHYHLLVSTPDRNLSLGMAYFQREVSRSLNRQGNRINRTFAGRYFRSYIKKRHYFINCYKYIYQNPLQAGLCERVETYKYSSLSGLLGLTPQAIPLEEDSLLFDGNLMEHFNWLNERVSDTDWDHFGKALKRGTFQLGKEKSTNRANRLETELL